MSLTQITGDVITSNTISAAIGSGFSSLSIGALTANTVTANVSVTTPIIQANTSTGILSIKSGTSPTTAITINASQNIGIGTTSPTTLFDLVKASTGDIYTFTGTGGAKGYFNVGGTTVQFSDTSSGGGNSVILGSAGTAAVRLQYGGTVGVTLDSSGNVGIGTSSPTNRLTVNGGSGSTPTIRLNGGTAADDNALLTSKYNLVLGCNADGNISSRAITFVNSTTENMRIDSSGNVGIGTSSPTFDSGSGLQISRAGVSTLRLSDTTDSTNLEIKAAVGAVAISGRGNYPLLFETNGSERMRIDSSGNLLVGTTSATIDASAGLFAGITPKQTIQTGSASNSYQRLVLIQNPSAESGSETLARVGIKLGLGGESNTGNSNKSGIIYAESTSGYNNGTSLCFATSNTERMRIDSSGNFDFKSGIITSTGTQNNTTGAGANMFISAGQMYRSTSSLKYKKNVKDATHGLSDLLKLRSVTYEGKAEADAGKTFGGLIAEEVDAAGLTEFVQYAPDGTPDALAYGNMVSLCIKAIQEQQALIQTLQTQVTSLQSQVTALTPKS